MSALEEATGGHQIVPPSWMSATGLRALALDDPCLLWLEHHGHKFGFEKDSEAYSFLGFIGQAGQKFEEHWLEHFAPEAARGVNEDWDVRNVNGFRRTVALMEAGCPVIAKAALWWAPEKIYGTADVVCKASWLYRKFPHLRPQLPQPDHYLVIDAKFTRNLDSTSKRTDLRMYEHQLRLYSYMLAHLQGYMPASAYLVTRDHISDPLAVDVGMKLGQPLDAQLVELRNRHLHIKLHGHKYLPWRDAIVAPNLGNAKDEPWHGAKKKIADLLPGGPMERLPFIGKHQKEALYSHGFTCLDDLLGVGAAHFPMDTLPGIGRTTARRIREVLQVNRAGKASAVPAALVPPRHALELYVDLEFLSDVNVDLENDWPHLQGCPMIFMVGVGWEEHGQWRFKRFVAAREDHAAEKTMFDEFLGFLNGKGVFSPFSSASLYHWSPAEVWQCRDVAQRHGLARLAALPWCDLREVFVHAPLCIPGSWGLGIKEVVQALGEYAPEYHSPWPDNLSNGLSAMVMGWEAYKQDKPEATQEMATLSKYLEADVMALLQVLRWLRASATRTSSAPTQSRRGGWYAWAQHGFCGLQGEGVKAGLVLPSSV